MQFFKHLPIVAIGKKTLCVYSKQFNFIGCEITNNNIILYCIFPIKNQIISKKYIYFYAIPKQLKLKNLLGKYQKKIILL